MISVLRRNLRRLATASSGSVAIIFSLGAPALFGFVGLAVDYNTLATQRSEIQIAADAGALAGARQYALANVPPAVITQIATSQTSGNLGAAPYPTQPDEITIVLNAARSAVSVTVQRYVRTMLMQYFADATNPVSYTSTAAYRGSSSPVCMLILDTSAPAAFSAQGSSSVQAPGCAIVSNSVSPTGISSSTSGQVKAAKICTAGGWTGINLTPQPAIDCPPVRDPLASLPAPYVSPPGGGSGANGCDHNNMQISAGSQTLFPGVYCGGLQLNTAGSITFMPGLYVIRNGSLMAGAGATLTGVGVGFYLTGPGAVLNLAPASSVTFSAPISGTMAGIIFREDSANPPLQQHAIRSITAQNLLGTLYFPQGDLFMGGQAQIGGLAAYTIVVARQIKTAQSTIIKLNSDYGATSVPVPQGLQNSGPANGSVSLIN